MAAVTVREGTHLGALAYYTLPAAEAGCFAMAVQNGPAIVPPYGGRSGIFSTNPFSWAVPAGQELPVVYDIATTAVAGNKVLLAKKARRPPPSPRAGPTTTRVGPPPTPRRRRRRTCAGSGATRGSESALMVEVLSGIVAGEQLRPTPSRPNASWWATAGWPRGGCF